MDLFETVTIRVDTKLKKEFIKKAKADGHTPTTFLRKVMQAYVQQAGSKNSQIGEKEDDQAKKMIRKKGKLKEVNHA
jgi:antitoxin component of RelBE/YafQ-DinJ toxin-antitoxin module